MSENDKHNFETLIGTWIFIDLTCKMWTIGIKQVEMIIFILQSWGLENAQVDIDLMKVRSSSNQVPSCTDVNTRFASGKCHSLAVYSIPTNTSLISLELQWLYLTFKNRSNLLWNSHENREQLTWAGKSHDKLALILKQFWKILIIFGNQRWLWIIENCFVKFSPTFWKSLFLSSWN